MFESYGSTQHNNADMINNRQLPLKSLQSKNTKNLSLEIDDSDNNHGVMVESFIPSRAPSAISKTHTDASIFKLPYIMKPGNSMCMSSQFDKNATVKRGKSSSLSIHTGSVKPPILTLTTSSPLRRRSNTMVECPINMSENDNVSLPKPYIGVQPSVPIRSWIFNDTQSPNKMHPCESNNVLHNNPKNDVGKDSIHIYTDVFKENAYPDGPLCVIPPNIYLYSEPTLDQVLNFDLIINAAKEIKSFESQLPDEKKVYYHHYRWSHTSKIFEDLFEITELIHDADVSNKKILIHCQCGVSRSASLVVAYIMRYQNLSLNDAYNNLKMISRDISPNMNLIFQLMEWGEWLKTQNRHTKLSPLIIPRSTNEIQQGINKNASNPNELCSLSADNTPCTPGGFINQDISPMSSIESENKLNLMNQNTPSQYSPILETFSPPRIK